MLGDALVILLSDSLDIVRWNLAQLPSAPGVAPIGNRPPVLDAVSPQTVTVGSDLRLLLSATDPDGDPVTFSATSLPEGATLDAESGALAWKPTASQVGTKTITIQADDGRCGTDSRDIIVTVLAANP